MGLERQSGHIKLTVEWKFSYTLFDSFILLYSFDSYIHSFICSTVFQLIKPPPWVFFTFFKFYKWYQIAQHTTYVFTVLKFPFTKIWTTLRSLKMFSSDVKRFNKVNSLCIGFTFNFLFNFFSLWVFFCDHSRFKSQQGKGKAMSLTPLYHFHPLHRYLDIRREITAKISLLRVKSLILLLAFHHTWTLKREG